MIRKIISHYFLTDLTTTQLPPYLMIGASSGVVLYLAKYTLYGVALLLGPGRDKYAAAAIEVDLTTIPEGAYLVLFDTSLKFSLHMLHCLHVTRTFLFFREMFCTPV